MEIGSGYQVKVNIDNNNPFIVKKTYRHKNLFYLANKQIEVQEQIKLTIKDDLENLMYVKIPHIISSKKTEETIEIVMDRIYNIFDTEDETLPMLNVIITNDKEEINRSPISGRGTVVTLDYVEEVLKTMINESLNEADRNILKTNLVCDYIRELGIIIALLNFKSELKTDDIEIVFGKDSIEDGIFKFYILDFDRCTKYNLNDLLEHRSKNTRIYNKTYDMLGRKDYFEFKTLKKEYKKSFKEGYESIAIKYIPIDFIKEILDDLDRSSKI